MSMKIVEDEHNPLEMSTVKAKDLENSGKRRVFPVEELAEFELDFVLANQRHHAFWWFLVGKHVVD